MSHISIDFHEPSDPKIDLLYNDLGKAVTLDISHSDEDDGDRIITIYFTDLNHAMAWLTSGFEQITKIYEDHPEVHPKLPTHLKLVPK